MLIDSKDSVTCNSDEIIQLWIDENETATDESQKNLRSRFMIDTTLKNDYITALNTIKDEGLILGDWLNVKYLFDRFENNVLLLARTHGKLNIESSFHGFQAFLSMIYIRRSYRVNKWMIENTKQFNSKADKSIIDKFTTQIHSLLHNLKTRLQLCGAQCRQGEGCLFPCLLPRFHENEGKLEHDCYGTHKCHQPCEYCTEEAKEAKQKAKQDEPGSIDDDSKHCEIEVCGYPSGHSGKHDCNLDVKDHSCGKPCSLSKYGNCKNKCSKEAGHEINWDDDVCLCDSDVHYCNHECDAPKCNQLCIVRHDKQHILHDCGARSCLFSCQVVCSTPINPAESKECGQPCACNNHFHQLNIEKKKEESTNEKTTDSKEKEGEKSRSGSVAAHNINDDHEHEIDFHCCMNEHYCGKKCQEDGIHVQLITDAYQKHVNMLV